MVWGCSLLVFAESDPPSQDWPNLAKYRQANQNLPAPGPGETRVVFMGDSITEIWGQTEFFSRKASYVNRGISGQTTPQMLVRFRQDVVGLKPKAVVLLAGINDIAENTGKTTLEAIEGNLASMCEIARANGIRVVLCSVLPASKFSWRPDIVEPASKVRALNAWIQHYAEENTAVYVDYYSSLVDDKGGLKAELGPDGVHPNRAGYDLMAPLVQAGIEQATR